MSDILNESLAIESDNSSDDSDVDWEPPVKRRDTYPKVDWDSFGMMRERIPGVSLENLQMIHSTVGFV